MTMHLLSPIKKIILITAIASLLWSCKKETTAPGNNTTALAPLSVEFDNVVGGQNLVLNTTNYTNTAGETYTIQLLQYIVSNFKVKKADGTTYTVNQDSSYFLIKEADPTTRLPNSKCPRVIIPLLVLHWV